MKESVTLTATLSADRLSVAQPDGSRLVVPGVYALSAAGRYPQDPRANLPANTPFTSNVETATCTLTKV